MTTGSVLSGFLTPGLPGGSYGRTFKRQWNGTDRTPSADAQKADADVRTMYLSPAHLRLANYVSPLGVKPIRDYNGLELAPLTVTIPKGSRLHRQKDHDWHPYYTYRENVTNATYNEYSVRTKLRTGGPYARNSTESSDHTSWASPGLLSSNDTNALYSDAWAKMRGSSFNLAISLAEGGEALHMIAGSAIKLAKAIHHLRRGDVSGCLRSLIEGTDRRPLQKHKNFDMRKLRDVSSRALAEKWLELQYGWLPLLGDVKACAESVAHRVTPPFRKSIVTMKSKDSTSIPSGQSLWDITTYRTEQIRLEFVATEAPSVAAELGLLDPYSVAWEVLPFSFVVDWFLPIGDFLEARQATASLKGVYRQSRKRSVQTIFSPRPTGNGVVFAKLEGPYPYAPFYHAMEFERYAETQAVRPVNPSFKGLGEAASWKHCLNAIALLKGARPPIS